jgi:hypothetical protein
LDFQEDFLLIVFAWTGENILEAGCKRVPGREDSLRPMRPLRKVGLTSMHDEDTAVKACP